MGDRFAHLAALLKESAAGANAFRIRQLESSLATIRQSDTAWDDARYILEQNSDPSMQYFALSVYEEWIATKWKIVPDARKAELIAFLLDLGIQHGKSLPYHVFMYLLKVIAHIGRLDWPKRAPDFIARVLDLAATPDTCMLGVSLLKIISEEWTHTRSRIKSIRRIKLRHMLAEEVPNIVAVFSQILVSLWSENVQENSVGTFGALDVNANYISNFGNNTEAADLAKRVLESLQSYIAWAPLNLVLQPSHIEILFKYAMLNDTTSCLALDNLNEMLERNFVPVELSAFLVQLHSASIALLGKMVKDDVTIASLDPDYVSKWTMFVNLFVQYHLRRDESLNFGEFLMLFGKYTFAQPTNEGWLDCLDIWEVILTLLDAHASNGISIAPFGDVVCDFSATLMRYILFRDNGEQLSTLEGGAATDETALTDEEEESELDSFLNAALTAIALAYGLYPEALQSVLLTKVQEPVADFLNLHTLLNNPLMNDQQVTAVYCTLRDVTTSVRAIALVGSQFINNFDATFNDALTCIRTLVDLTTYIKQQELQKYSPEAARLAAELFGAMRAFSEWCGVYWAALQSQPDADCSTFDEIISAMINCDGLALQSRSLGIPEEPANIPELIPLSAAVHLRNLAAVVKSPRLASLAVVGQLFSDIHVIASWHTSDVQQSLYVALTFVYLVPWNALQANAQQWDARAAEFAPLLEGLLAPFEQAATPVITREISPQTVHVKEVIDRSLVVLTGILRESASRLDKAGFTILWNTLETSLKGSLELLEFYMEDLPMLFRLLQLHIQVFSVLAPYVPVELASMMLSALISNLTSQQNRLESLLVDTGGFGSAVAQRLLCLIKALVSRANAPFLGDAYAFCMERIYPSILEGLTSIEVEQSFYEIWCELLLRHYKFFTQNEETYRTALTVFLRALQGQDLDIYRLCVGSLLGADQKHHLFSQPIFWTEGYASFLATLFHVMIQKSHEPIHEEILKLVFQIIAGSGFDPFFDEFLPSFLIDTSFFNIPQNQRDALRNRLGRHTDPPTLTKGIENLLNDLSFLSGAMKPT
jgi:hypothetical protein